MLRHVFHFYELAIELGFCHEAYLRLNSETTPKKPKVPDGLGSSSSTTIAIMPPVEQLSVLKFEKIKQVGNVILERELQSQCHRVHRLTDNFKRWVGAASDKVELKIHQGEVAILKVDENIFERVDGKDFSTVSAAVQPTAEVVAAKAVVEQQMKAEAEQRRLETETNQAQEAANQAQAAAQKAERLEKELELQQEASRQQLESQNAIFNSALQRQQHVAIKLENAQDALKQQTGALKQLEKEKTELENILKAEAKNELQKIQEASARNLAELQEQTACEQRRKEMELEEAARNIAIQKEELRRQSEQLQLELAQVKTSPTERNCLSHTN